MIKVLQENRNRERRIDRQEYSLHKEERLVSLTKFEGVLLIVPTTNRQLFIEFLTHKITIKILSF